ncbi:hypothetical protein [Oceanobacillus halotolerans]|uniref:hypothetical protein n=1 Tax=Oceanobacillus halotolerans TaxID=2663380 RepID=UPI0013DC80BB|nr:hypothetical protein [Oceanobacillus halotolerans]
MSEQNKNRNKDKGKQRNVIKYDTAPKRNRHNEEIAEESEFLNINGKRNKRERG